MEKSTFLNTVPVHGTGILQNLISHCLDRDQPDIEFFNCFSHTEKDFFTHQC
jgi:hypothetical protein